MYCTFSRFLVGGHFFLLAPGAHHAISMSLLLSFFVEPSIIKHDLYELLFGHSDYRTVSPYWVLPVYVELIRAVWADDGDRPHYYFDEMRRSLNLVQNQLFALKKLNIYNTNCLTISAAVQKKGT
jgi:hypothetical protein